MVILCARCKKEGVFSPSQLERGDRRRCRECVKNAKAKWRGNNSEKNKDYSIQYYQSNKDYLINQTKEYKENNKEKTLQTKREYRQKNRSTLLIKRRNYTKTKRKIDVNFRLRDIISCHVKNALKNRSSSKNGRSCLDYLGYTIEELKNHIEKQFEPWMNWNNQGKYIYKMWDDTDQFTWTWQIDHIIPCSNFQYTSMEDRAFQDCWALSNLRPLSAKQNLLKSNKMETV